MKSKKLLTSAVALGTAAALTLGGTFAWQSISQKALNEASDIVNPGGRLHNDQNWVSAKVNNNDIYVENFTDPENGGQDIFARVRLAEYMEIVMNKGVVGAEVVETVVGKKTLDGVAVTDKATDNTSGYEYEYVIHKFGEDAENATDDFFIWSMGEKDGERPYYIPTFNVNKDSLLADLNGEYVDAVGGISNREAAQYEWDEITSESTADGYEVFDNDTNKLDEVGRDDLKDLIENGTDAENYETLKENIVLSGEKKTHNAAQVGETKGFISMAQWKELAATDGYVDEDGLLTAKGEEKLFGYWVYDADGWVYWSAPIKAGTTTGLLLDGFKLDHIMDDTWYYAIDVTAQFVTADDVGKANDTGFYALDTTPAAIDEDGETTETAALPVSEEAEELLELIGVHFPKETTDDDSNTGDDSTPGGEDGDNSNPDDGKDEVVDTSPALTLKATPLPTVSFIVNTTNKGTRILDADGQPVSMEDLVVKSGGTEYQVGEETDFSNGIYCTYKDGKLKSSYDIMEGKGPNHFFEISKKGTDLFGCIPSNAASNPGGTKASKDTLVNAVADGCSGGNVFGNLAYDENLVIVPVESLSETVGSNAEKALTENVDYTVEYSEYTSDYFDQKPYANNYCVTKIAEVTIDARYAGQLLKTYTVKDDGATYYCNVIFVDPNITESIVPETPDNDDAANEETAEEIIRMDEEKEGLKVTYKRQANAVYMAGSGTVEFKLKPEYNNTVVNDTSKLTLTVNVDGEDKATVTGNNFEESTADGTGWLKCTPSDLFTDKTDDVIVKLTLTYKDNDIDLTTEAYKITFTKGGTLT